MYVNEFGFSVCVLFLAALLQLIEELSILQLFWLTRILSEGLLISKLDTCLTHFKRTLKPLTSDSLSPQCSLFSFI